MPRLARKMSESKIYHVMLRGNERRKIFMDDEDRLRFLNTLGIKKSQQGFELYA